MGVASHPSLAQHDRKRQKPHVARAVSGFAAYTLHVILFGLERENVSCAECLRLPCSFLGNDFQHLLLRFHVGISDRPISSSSSPPPISSSSSSRQERCHFSIRLLVKSKSSSYIFECGKSFLTPTARVTFAHSMGMEWKKRKRKRKKKKKKKKKKKGKKKKKKKKKKS